MCSLNEVQTAELDGIVAVGGDGLFHEVVNGLLALRAARDGTPHADVASSLRLGHLPAGSTDTVAYTLHGTRSVTTAAIRIVLGDRNPLDIARVDMLRSQTHTFAVSMISYGYLGDLMKVRDSRTWSVCIALRIHGACVHFLCTFPTVGERAAAAPGAAALRGRRCQGALQQPYLQGQGLLLGRRRCRCPRHHVRPCSTIVDDRITTVHSADHAVHRAQGVCMANCMHCNYNAHLDVPAPQGASAERETVKFTKAAKRVSLVRSQTRGCCM